MKITGLEGEGATPKDALEALAFGLWPKKLDYAITIILEKATIKKIGSEETYEGYRATAKFHAG